MGTWTDELSTLETHIRRAPSAHNTQPWTLTYAEDHITIGWNPTRELPAGDPTRRDLYLSLGAFTETALIVAADAGLNVRAEIALDLTRHTAARLLPTKTRYPTPYTTHTVEARRTARGPYQDGRLPTTTLDRIGTQLTTTGLSELPAHELKTRAHQADTWLYANRPAVKELRSWLRLGRGPYPDGLTAAALNLTRPESTALGLALKLHPALRHLGLPHLLATTQKGLLNEDTSILILTGDPQTPEAMIEAGRDLARAWYALTDLNLTAHPLSQLLDCPTTATALQRRVGARPLAAFRAGSPRKTPPRSNRHPATKEGGGVRRP